jgi:hypothetical protein
MRADPCWRAVLRDHRSGSDLDGIMSNKQVTNSWTAADFWEYVSGLTGDFERDQMRVTLAEKGLNITVAVSYGPSEIADRMKDL